MIHPLHTLTTSALLPSFAIKTFYHNKMMNKILSLAVVTTFLQLVGAFQANNMNLGRIQTNLKSTVFDDAISAEETTGSRSLPPLLKNMADERREFEVNLGKAMDTLRKDYPNMLHKQPGKRKDS